MSKTKKNVQFKVVKQQIQKSDIPLQLTEQQIYHAGDWIMPANNMIGLRKIVRYYHNVSEHIKIILQDLALVFDILRINKKHLK